MAMTLDDVLTALERRGVETPETSATPSSEDTPARCSDQPGQATPAGRRQPLAPVTADEERAIRAWLALIGETAPATIAEVVSQCQRDADARDYFTGRAGAELPKPDPFPDDQRTCRQCVNLQWGICRVASPGGLVSANSGYRPMPDMPHRCAGYMPNAEDADRRPGAESWPDLSDAKGARR